MLNMLAPLLAGLHQEATADPRNLDRGRGAEDSDLIEGLWQETLNLAVRSAAVASLLNGLEKSGSLLDQERAAAVLGMAHSDLPIANAIFDKVLPTPLPPRTVDLLRGLYALVATGRAGIEEAAAHGPTGSIDVDETELHRVTLHHVAETWREIAGVALSLIYDLELAALRAAPDLDIEATAELTAALREARDSGSPCLDAKGRPFIPYWAQKRADLRRRVKAKAHVEHGGVIHAVEIRDASASGLGIALQPKLASGSSLAVILDDGERLAATVVWSAGGRAGLQLARRLPARHRLLGGKAGGSTAT